MTITGAQTEHRPGGQLTCVASLRRGGATSCARAGAAHCFHRDGAHTRPAQRHRLDIRPNRSRLRQGSAVTRPTRQSSSALCSPLCLLTSDGMSARLSHCLFFSCSMMSKISGSMLCSLVVSRGDRDGAAAAEWAAARVDSTRAGAAAVAAAAAAATRGTAVRAASAEVDRRRAERMVKDGREKARRSGCRGEPQTDRQTGSWTERFSGPNSASRWRAGSAQG